MFDETLTLSDGSANHSFSTVVSGDYKRIRREPDSNLDVPKLHTISHTLDEKTQVSRSMGRVDFSFENATTGEVGVVSVYTVVVIPRKVVTPTEVKKVIAINNAFWSVSGNQDKIINLES